MSENESGDNREQPRGKEPQIGLSFPRDNTDEDASSSTNRPRRKPGAYENLQRAARVDDGVVARWFLPLAVLFLILFVIGIAIFLAQSSRLDDLERQVTALEKQAAGADPVSGLERIRDRVEALEERSSTPDSVDAEIRALRDVVAEQGGKIEALTGRLDKLAQSSGGSGAGESESNNDSGTPSGRVEGGWLINLITVADRASAEAFQKRLDKLDVTSRIQSVTVDNKTLLRVVVPGFQSRDAAENTGNDLKKRLELSDDPWITRQ